MQHLFFLDRTYGAGGQRDGRGHAKGITCKAKFAKEIAHPLLASLAKLAGSNQQAALLLIVLSLAVGFIKGRLVLSKSAQRVVRRILSLPNPIHLSQAYSKGYLMLVGGMVLMGMSLKWLNLPLDVRGAIDVAIGSALMNGALAFIRCADTVRKQRS